MEREIFRCDHCHSPAGADSGTPRAMARLCPECFSPEVPEVRWRRITKQVRRKRREARPLPRPSGVCMCCSARFCPEGWGEPRDRFCSAACFLSTGQGFAGDQERKVTRKSRSGRLPKEEPPSLDDARRLREG